MTVHGTTSYLAHASLLLIVAIEYLTGADHLVTKKDACTSGSVAMNSRIARLEIGVVVRIRPSVATGRHPGSKEEWMNFTGNTISFPIRSAILSANGLQEAAQH